MFTGIIECLGEVTQAVEEGTNLIYTIASPISHALKVDQSVAHDGVCLTVTNVDGSYHQVTAVRETLLRSNLESWKVGTAVNLERAMQQHARLDGHMVQGHVDATGTLLAIVPQDGSWALELEYPDAYRHLLVDKGSVCVNGISLTVVQPINNTFQLAIIPYTWEHTTLSQLVPGSKVNLEFDILGKYVARYLSLYPSVQSA